MPINETSKHLQKVNIDLHVAVSFIKSLEDYLLNIREKFDYYLDKSKKFIEPRIRKRSVRRTRNEGASSNTNFTHEESLKIEVLYPIIDSLCVNLKMRKSAYEKRMSGGFHFFTKLQKLDVEHITESCEKVAEMYDRYLHRMSHFRMFTL